MEIFIGCHAHNHFFHPFSRPYEGTLAHVPMQILRMHRSTFLKRVEIEMGLKVKMFAPMEEYEK